MSLIVKLMAADNLPDCDTRKGHKLFTGVSAVDFSRDERGQAFAHLFFVGEVDPETFVLNGNAYVMNEAGKTVSSFGSSPPPGTHVASADDHSAPREARLAS